MIKHFCIGVVFLLLTGTLSAQTSISGSVVHAETKRPIAGASIQSKNAGVITQTNTEGHFAIQVSAFPDTLYVTYIGFVSNRIVVKSGQYVYTATLTPVEGEMEQVWVNTGYQKVKPNEINGSVTVIDNKMLNQQTGTNILQRLNGVTNGLLFNVGKSGSSASGRSPNDISIRGLSTIDGPLSPLIILDDFPYEGDINNINPDEVESVSILKDAAAASIWGARAGNGVIVITTKKGKLNQPLKVSFNSNVIITEKPDPHSLLRTQMATSDYIEIEKFLFDKGYFNTVIDNVNSFPALTPVVSILQQIKSGKIPEAEGNKQIELLKEQSGLQQFRELFQQTGITQQYALSLTGGSSYMSWLLSGNHNRVTNTDLSTTGRSNARFENTLKILKNLSLSLGAFYTNSTAKDGAPEYTSLTTQASRYVPYQIFTDRDGSPIGIPRYRKEFLDTIGNGRLLDWLYYPAANFKQDFTKQHLQELIGRANISWSPFEGFNATAMYQYQKQWTSNERWSGEESYYTRDLINRFTTLGTGTTPNVYNIPKGAIRTQSISNLISYNLRGQVNYSRSFGSHYINLISGAEIREVETINAGNFTVYGYIEEPLSVASVNYATNYRTLIGGAVSRIPGTPGIGNRLTNRFVSLLSNAQYSYKSRYHISGSWRRDAANIFGANTNDKWNPLWSVGGGWDISKEKFYRWQAISFLKLRASLGYSGNIDSRKTPLATSGSSTNSITNFPTQSISQLNNPDLRWEKSRQFNIGVDFSTRGKDISGSIEYYVKKGTDLYGNTLYDYTTWGAQGTVVTNTSNMRGQGIDLNLRSNNISRADFNWQTALIYNYNASKTTRYFSDDAKEFNMLLDGNSITPVVGEPLYSITSYRWGGLNNQGDPQGYLNGQLSTDYNAIDNSITADGVGGGSLVFIGTSVPTHFGSIINELRWKRLTFSFNLMYKMGYYFRKTAFTLGELHDSGIGHPDYYKRWQKAGDELHTDVPAYVYSDYPQYGGRDAFYRYASVHALKGDHIRFHYLNIAFDLASGKTKGFLQNGQVYGNLANLGIIWRANKDHLDPDYPNTYAPPKQATIGFRCSF
ncbi:SusC/RagA family TonB-linked outer membrane protein [Niabella sp. CJ426]|uniref:SusC/RagA family TonB-linked outer membrane protein n=1 Tax=Niabella sp. CJ426 TaxID=3393740 RepID=UPI003CFF9504